MDAGDRLQTDQAAPESLTNKRHSRKNKHSFKEDVSDTYDRFGRLVSKGTPIGVGDTSWVRNYGFGSGPKAPLLGIGISRDSFLSSECKRNEKLAGSNDERDNKLPLEIINWCKDHDLDIKRGSMFREKLLPVAKRTKSLETLNLHPDLLDELRPLIYKRAAFTLQDKRQPNAHFGTSTREQAQKSQMWRGVVSKSEVEVTYNPSFKTQDARSPAHSFGTGLREGRGSIRARKISFFESNSSQTSENAGKETLSSAMNQTELKEDGSTMGKANYLSSIPTQPKFSFGTSKRPPINGITKESPPIYNVIMKSKGVPTTSFGPRERTKSRVPKSSEWGAPLQPRGPKKFVPTRFGLVLAKVPYSSYKLYG